ncbi:MAG: hypothetical protein GY846_24150 [Deltaproteobacteria bacterium]|nr:hypothetical protein [Deltaproteobacteria bacterium]
MRRSWPNFLHTLSTCPLHTLAISWRRTRDVAADSYPSASGKSAATNRDIEQEVKDGKFRRGLFYRLNLLPIVVPPLRERSEDIPLLVRRFVKEFRKKMGKEIETIPKKTLQAFD